MARWTRVPNDETDTEIAAYMVLEKLRWPDGPECPHCFYSGAYFIAATNGKTRKTGSNSESARRLWKCQNCRRHFSVLIGTAMSGSHVPISKWIKALSILIVDPEMPARMLATELELSPRSAWKLRRTIQDEFLQHHGNP